MTTQEKKIKLAEALGFVNKPQHYDYLGEQGVCDHWMLYDSKGNIISNGLPDWPNDLNAMREAEKSLVESNNPELVFKYTDTLCKIYGVLNSVVAFIVVCASADKRFHALGITLGLWKEND